MPSTGAGGRFSRAALPPNQAATAADLYCNNNTIMPSLHSKHTGINSWVSQAHWPYPSPPCPWAHPKLTQLPWPSLWPLRMSAGSSAHWPWHGSVPRCPDVPPLTPAGATGSWVHRPHPVQVDVEGDALKGNPNPTWKDMSKESKNWNIIECLISFLLRDDYIYILYMCIHTVYIYTQMYVSLCIIQILQVYIYRFQIFRIWSKSSKLYTVYRYIHLLTNIIWIRQPALKVPSAPGPRQSSRLQHPRPCVSTWHLPNFDRKVYNRMKTKKKTLIWIGWNPKTYLFVGWGCQKYCLPVI
jgi:hypothetical protein